MDISTTSGAYMTKLKGSWQKLKGEINDKKADATLAAQEGWEDFQQQTTDFETRLEALAEQGEELGGEAKAKVQETYDQLEAKWNELMEKAKS